MNNEVLSPFDKDMIATIKGVLKAEVTATINGSHIVFEANAPSATIDELTALVQAIKGRVGRRFVDFAAAKDGLVVITILVENHDFPEQHRYELREPVNIDGTRYARKLKEVNAMMFRREDLGDILNFTGGGTVTIPRYLQGSATYEFPADNGTFLTVKEGEYIVKEENGHFHKMSKRDFELDFEAKNETV